MSAQESKPGVEEVGESLTGFDEIAIERAFGVTGLDGLSGTRSVRAMAFTLLRRQGRSDAEAYQESMSLPLGGVMDMFDTDGEGPAVTEAEAALLGVEESDQGKGGGPAVAEQRS